MSENIKPAVTVVLSTTLVRLFPGAETEVRLSARTVKEMLDELEDRWPGMRDRLMDSTPGIRKHMNIFVEGRKASLGTKLEEGMRVYILTAMSGG